MKKLIILLIFLLSIGTVLCIESARVTAGGSGLILRESPGTSYKKVTIIPTGDIVQIINKDGEIETIAGKKGTWYKVRYMDHYGYCFSAFLTPIDGRAGKEYKYDRSTEVVNFTEKSTLEDVVIWWKSAWMKPKTTGLQKKVYLLNNMKAGKKNKKVETYTIELQSKKLITIDVPLEKLDHETPNYNCTNNTSKLTVVEFGTTTEISLNPYCSETYEINEVDFVLYYLPNTEYPLIVLTTNGPACIPSKLYEFDTTLKKYVLSGEKCGG